MLTTAPLVLQSQTQLSEAWGCFNHDLPSLDTEEDSAIRLSGLITNMFDI